MTMTIMPLLLLATSATTNMLQDAWRVPYQVGQQVQFTISGQPSDFQPCVVTENNPVAALRVHCEAFRQWVAGDYIVYGPSQIRPAGPPPATGSPAPSTTPAPSTPAPAGTPK
jgi:hypothetical protein